MQAHVEMTDEVLGAELCPDDPALGSQLAAKMADKMPEKRQALARIVAFADEWNAYARGEGPMPDMADVIVCRGGRYAR